MSLETLPSAVLPADSKYGRRRGRGLSTATVQPPPNRGAGISLPARAHSSMRICGTPRGLKAQVPAPPFGVVPDDVGTVSACWSSRDASGQAAPRLMRKLLKERRNC
jgi:hypothetical protein